MKRKRSIIRSAILIVLIVAIVSAIYMSQTKDHIKVLSVGDPAPNFELVDLNGNKIKLSDYEGKAVVLNFWGTWCNSCIREMPALENGYQMYRDDGLEVISINLGQTKFEVEKYIGKYNLSFPITIDQTRAVTNTYNATLLPTTIFINKDGEIQYFVKGEVTEETILGYMKDLL